MSIAQKLLKLKNANYKETEVLFLPDNTQVIISTLTGEEDRDIADYLRGHLDKSLAHYTKLEIIAYAVKWFKLSDGMEINLRDLSHIETGEVLDNGTPVRKKRSTFMRDIVNSWPDIIIDALYSKYAMLMESIEKNIEKGIKVEYGDSGLHMKIDSIVDELRDLVFQAKERDLPIDEDLKSFFGAVKQEERGDSLLQALKDKKPLETTPTKILQSEVIEEVPTGIRQ